MLIFKSIEYKNFLSAGANPIHIDLDQCQNTLVIGENGSGKTSFTHAITYALFGKTSRGVNKPQLINSINERECLVTCIFETGGDEYKIVRGMKPNIFEIWKNGVLENQDSHARDYQKVLEKQILKINFKTFQQVVILSSRNFVPFMQLPLSTRREVVEDLLDITIFSGMNSVLKERKFKLRDTLSALENHITSLDRQVALQKKHIYEITTITTENKDLIRKDVDDIIQNMEALQKKVAQYTHEFKSFPELSIEKREEKKNKLHGFRGNIQSKLKRIEKQHEFFSANNVCPTCQSTIDTDFKVEMIHTLETELNSLQAGFDELERVLKQAEQDYAEALNILQRRDNLRSLINNTNREIQRKDAALTAKQALLNATIDDDRLRKSQDALSKLVDERNEQHSEKIRMSEERSYYEVIENLLKDSGIKTKIIRRYLPVMNKIINEYLQVFEFFVLFTLDENFNEVIKSRHRDAFTYGAFSEGEKSRLDLAIIFAWREIARLKNSADTNLLILDEVMDSAIDLSGIDSLLQILMGMDSRTRTFIISHRPEVKDNSIFNRVMAFSKKNNFSVLNDLT